MILRLAGAFAIYAVLNTVLKLPFSSNFLDSGTTLALAVRAIRYFIITIVIIGVYPMMFRLGDKIFKKKSS